MEVQKMDAEKYQRYVAAEFEKLAMCKRGKLNAERDKRIGPQPKYTAYEKEDLITDRAHLIRLAMVEEFKTTIDDIDVLDMYHNFLSSLLESHVEIDDLFNHAVKGLFDHPDFPAWEKRAMKIREEFRIREIAMEKTIANMVRNFCTGVLLPAGLNVELDTIEITEF